MHMHVHPRMFSALHLIFHDVFCPNANWYTMKARVGRQMGGFLFFCPLDVARCALRANGEEGGNES